MILTVRSEFLQFVGLSGIRLKSFELFKTLATISPIRKSCVIRTKFLRHSWTSSLNRNRFGGVFGHS